VNLYGATKLCQDKLAVAANNFVGQTKKPLFSVVRYGNVAGTRGSLIPYWKQLLAEGAKELPITDPRMTRFWITLEEAGAFVFKQLKEMRGGEIFVPKLPSFYIKDVKNALAPHAKLKMVGIRPGEKLHELLISQDEARHTLEFKDHFAIYPEFTFREDLPNYEKMSLSKKGTPLKEGFTYISSHNSEWLGVKELQKQLLLHG
jgi:UDP-N-acetylglucosamine 4,6-dehydratase